VLTIAAVLTIFVYGLMSPVLGVLLPTYALNSGQQGGLALTNALGLVVASLSAGPLIDSKGKKTALLIGLPLIASALLAAPNAVGYRSLLAIYFTLGAGAGTVVTGANSLVGDMAGERRGSVLNFLNLFFGLGSIITTYAASYLFSPTTVCYSIAVLVAGVLLIDARVPIPKPAEERRFQLSQVPNLLSNPILLMLSLLLFLYVGCEVSVWNWLKTYLISVHLGADTAGGIVSYGFGLGMLLGRVLASRLLVKIPAMSVITGSSVLVASTTFAMLNVSSRSGVMIAVFCAGLAMAPIFPTTLAIVGNKFPCNTATAMGIVITSGWLGLAVSSQLVGVMAAKSTLQHALLLLPLLGSAMVLVNMVLNIRLRNAVFT
jgi:fucose permease